MNWFQVSDSLRFSIPILAARPELTWEYLQVVGDTFGVRSLDFAGGQQGRRAADSSTVRVFRVVRGLK